MPIDPLSEALLSLAKNLVPPTIYVVAIIVLWRTSRQDAARCAEDHKVLIAKYEALLERGISEFAKVGERLESLDNGEGR